MVGTLRFAHPTISVLFDRNPPEAVPHGRYAQTARRANLSQAASADFQKSS
jgi:hypothetical protein